MKRIALALFGCFWASLAFGQATAQFQGLPGSGNSGYPPTSTPFGAAQTATTGGINVALAAVPNQFSYLCGISISPGAATTAIVTVAALTNLASAGPNNFTWSVGAPAVATAGATGTILTVNFWPCMRSNTTNQGIGLTVGALGAGGVGQAASMWGYSE